MSQRLQTARVHDPRPAIEKLFMVGAAIFAVAAAAPNAAQAHGDNISINGLNFGDDEDLLEQLIDLDADDIEDIRHEMADAREEIAEAIIEIEDAREEIKEAPGGAVIAKIALSTASAVVTKTTGKIFEEIKADLNDAADELETLRGKLSDAEYDETKMAISMLREEIAELETALSDLTDAMRT